MTNLQGFLVVLAIYFAAVALVMVNVTRSAMAATADCTKVTVPPDSALPCIHLLCRTRPCLGLSQELLMHASVQH